MLLQLLKKQHLADALEVAEMRDGVVVFELDIDADRYASMLEEEGHSQVGEHNVTPDCTGWTQQAHDGWVQDWQQRSLQGGLGLLRDLLNSKHVGETAQLLFRQAWSFARLSPCWSAVPYKRLHMFRR